MNKHAYLIIANKNQGQLQKLINTIDDSRNDIYLLLDKKSINNFTKKFRVQYSDLNILKPIDIFWGNYSQIQAELNLFDAAHYGHYDYYHLLSGSDLPLTNQDEIHNFFDNHPNKEFITYSAINDANQLSIRLHNYQFTKKFRSSNKLYNLIHKCEFSFFKNKPEKRLILNDIASGSQWVSLEDNLVNDILRNNDQIFYLFHNGYLVDELMIPIFINLHTKYKKKIFYKEPVHDKPDEFQGNLRYINWWDGSPYVWRLKDYPILCNAYNHGHLFSRKFDETVDNDIIDKIVKKILE